MTLAWFDLESGRLAWTGVGNVEGRLVHAGAGYGAPTEGALTKGGVVGYNLPSIRVTSTDLDARRRDGARDRRDRLPLRARRSRRAARRRRSPTGSSPSTARPSDDALVVVVRYLPAG